jgi:inosine-uridine nucleoside N-ribohydrolase
MALLIDTDPGCDDALAILLALESDLDVVGLTTVAGNAPVKDTTNNALAILEFFDYEVPVARGANRPLVKQQDTAEFIHGEGGIQGELPDPTSRTVNNSAAEFIVERARDHGELTIAAIGPLTNLALALSIDPDLPEFLDQVLIMGGAVAHAGNRTPAAEANLHADPDAANRVLQSTDPTFVSLDVTSRAILQPDQLGLSETARDETVREWLTYYPEEVRKRFDYDGTPVHDAAVIAQLTDSVLTTEEYYLQIKTDNGLSRGALIADKFDVAGEPANASLATNIDEQRFCDALAGAIESAV